MCFSCYLKSLQGRPPGDLPGAALERGLSDSDHSPIPDATGCGSWSKLRRQVAKNSGCWEISCTTGCGKRVTSGWAWGTQSVADVCIRLKDRSTSALSGESCTPSLQEPRGRRALDAAKPLEGAGWPSFLEECLVRRSPLPKRQHYPQLMLPA